MGLKIETVACHRNGVCGAPFYVVLFEDDGPMLAVVFEAEHHCAVLGIDKLAAGDVAFGSNSWRGDTYERAMRAAIARADRCNQT